MQIRSFPAWVYTAQPLKKLFLGNKLEIRSIAMEIQCGFSLCIKLNWFFKCVYHGEGGSRAIKFEAQCQSVSAALSCSASCHSHLTGDQLPLHPVPSCPPRHLLEQEGVWSGSFFGSEALAYVTGHLQSSQFWVWLWHLYFNLSPAVWLAETQMGSRAVGNQKNWKVSWKPSEALTRAELLWDF